MVASSISLKFIDIREGSNGSNPSKYYVEDNRVFFSAYRDDIGREIFWMDLEDPDESLSAIDVNSEGVIGNGHSEFFHNGNRLFFSATLSGSGSELHWIDLDDVIPTAQLVEIDSAQWSSVDQNPEIVFANNRAFFAAYDPEIGNEIHSIDLNATELTAEPLDLNGGVLSSSPENLTLVGDRS